MKTRILHTKVWKDSYFYNLDDKEKLTFLYLMANENVNMVGVYEINDVELQTWLKVTPEKLKLIKDKFTKDKKYIFKGDWVCVVNHNKYNNYGKGMQEKALQREKSLIPIIFKSILDTSINTSIDTRHNTEIRNKKEEIRNKKEANTSMQSLRESLAKKGILK